MKKNVILDLELMNYIQNPPKKPKDMHAQACSSDEITITSWRDQWISQVKANHKKYGPFKDHSLGSLWGKWKNSPAIVAGSGPSLRNSVEAMKNRGDVPLISCLHNFHYMIDHGIDVDYYVTLDAGDITIGEIAEGGKESLEYYIEQTKGKTLIAFIGSHPKLLESWKGDILFYNAPIPDNKCAQEFANTELFECYVSNGGNVLGACLYIAKAVMGANPIAFVGADFCFSKYGEEGKIEPKQFHPWKSKYDGHVGQAMRTVDIYGNNVLTWNSYWNFKNFFDYVVCQVPGIYFNCSMEGIFGAYQEGNIMRLIQMPLDEFLKQFNLCSEIEHMCKHPDNAKDPKSGQIKLLF